MPLGSPLIHCLCVVNDCDEPVAVLPNVENHVSLYVVGIFERAANFRKIVSSNLFDDNHACFDHVRCIWVLLYGLVQMLARDATDGRLACPRGQSSFRASCEILGAFGPTG